MGLKNAYFKGIARVRIENLQFEPSRHVDEIKVKRLLEKFESLGCQNDEISYAIPALISQTTLNEALVKANLSPSALFNIEEHGAVLDLPALTCVYGIHRTRAAQQFLCASERFWTVRLYDIEMPSRVFVSVQQENQNALITAGGNTLASVLAEKDQKVVDCWLSQASAGHRKICNRIRIYDGGKLSATLQHLLRFRGLRCGMRTVGRWGPIFAMHCYEEVQAYLKAIAETWTYILDEDILPECLSESTVLALQLLSPADSKHDHDAVTRLFTENKLFPSVENPTTRASLAKRVLSYKRIVSLESFFNDFIFLRTCFDGLNSLLPPRWASGKRHRSFRDELAHNFKGKHDFMNCYLDLWLFAMREFPYLSKSKSSQPLQDETSNGDQIEVRGCCLSKKVELAHLAHELGFQTVEISRLLAAFPSEIPQKIPISGKAETTCDDIPLNREARSNRPSETSYRHDKDSLHRVQIFETPKTATRRLYSTTFAILQDIAHCCWKTDVPRWVPDSPTQRAPYLHFEDPVPPSETQASRAAKSCDSSGVSEFYDRGMGQKTCNIVPLQTRARSGPIHSAVSSAYSQGNQMSESTAIEDVPCGPREEYDELMEDIKKAWKHVERETDLFRSDSNLYSDVEEVSDSNRHPPRPSEMQARGSEEHVGGSTLQLGRIGKLASPSEDAMSSEVKNSSHTPLIDRRRNRRKTLFPPNKVRGEKMIATLNRDVVLTSKKKRRTIFPHRDRQRRM